MDEERTVETSVVTEAEPPDVRCKGHDEKVDGVMKFRKLNPEDKRSKGEKQNEELWRTNPQEEDTGGVTEEEVFG